MNRERIDWLFSIKSAQAGLITAQPRQLSVTESPVKLPPDPVRDLHGQEHATPTLPKVQQADELHAGENGRTQVSLHRLRRARPAKNTRDEKPPLE